MCHVPTSYYLSQFHSKVQLKLNEQHVITHFKHWNGIAKQLPQMIHKTI